MKHCQNKSNISTIRDYLKGDRPFTQISLYQTEKDKLRSVGDIWKDAKGTEWKKTEYGIININKQANLIRKLKEQQCLCGQKIKWGTRLDQIFFNKTGLCENCLINYETNLRILGIYSTYETYKLLSNEFGFLKDMEQKLLEVIKFFSENSGDVEMICNSDGFVERWKGANKDQILEDSQRDLKIVVARIKMVIEQKEEVKSKYIEETSKYKLETYV